MKKIAALFLALGMLMSMTACEKPGENLISETKATSAPTAPPAKTTYGERASVPASEKAVFSNEYGTSATRCAHEGCQNPIASSGDTNCCTVHSNKCAECGRYIDEDATWCMSCLSSALSSSSNGSSSSYASSSASASSSKESYYCMGKNDTCPNKTYSPWDFYCSSCDPDGDNKEG